MNQTFKIEGLKCSGCVQSVEEIFSSLEGVGRITASLTDHTVKIESTKEYRVDELQGILDENNAPYEIDEM